MDFKRQMNGLRQRNAEIVLSYHERTKHRLDRYAAGPETLDWDEPPNPYREFAGSPRIPLGRSVDRIGMPVSVAAVGVVLAMFRIVSLCSMSGAVTAIVLVCVFDEDTPVELLQSLQRQSPSHRSLCHRGRCSRTR